METSLGKNELQKVITDAVGETKVKKDYIHHDLNTIFELAFGVGDSAEKLRRQFLNNTAKSILEAIERAEDEKEQEDRN